LELPRDRLIVFTGVSGSGKSSLATLSSQKGSAGMLLNLSAYARQFGQVDKPDVEAIEGWSPRFNRPKSTSILALPLAR